MLESDLAALYGELINLQQSLSVAFPPNESDKSLLSKSGDFQIEKLSMCYNLPKKAYVNIVERVEKCCRLLPDVCFHLLTLSVLVPSAPWVSDYIPTPNLVIR